MFARIEVAIRPEYSDPTAQSLLKRIHGQLPELRKKIGGRASLMSTGSTFRGLAKTSFRPARRSSRIA
jgi:hypothetical protein